MKKLLVLIRGVSGSGKSTLAKKVVDNSPYFPNHLETDAFFTDLTTQEYKFDVTKLKDFHERCLHETVRLMTLSGMIVVSNTFTRQWELHKYLLAAELFDYEVLMIDCLGDYGSIHDVPDEVIANQKERFEDSLTITVQYPNVNWSKLTIDDLI